MKWNCDGYRISKGITIPDLASKLARSLFLVNLRYGISLGLLVISVIQTNTISKISYWILLTRKSIIAQGSTKLMTTVNIMTTTKNKPVQ